MIAIDEAAKHTAGQKHALIEWMRALTVHSPSFSAIWKQSQMQSGTAEKPAVKNS